MSMSRFSLFSGISLSACAVAISSAACAQESRSFAIPAGSLDGALTAFATQADQQLLYSEVLVAGKSSAGLTGRFLPSVALERLLAGTGLSARETRPGVILLYRPELASHERGDAATLIDDVIVTGSLLRNGGDIASPLVTLNRDDLDRSGRATVADVLTDLPQNYSGSGTLGALMTGADGSGSNSALSTGVNLRGLGPDATLVLLNGRRLAGTGFRAEFADVSAIPSAAVERVDVLLDGASALYGSDAVAGVVNVILRQNYDGQESRVRLGAARGGAEDIVVSHLAGRSWGRGSALLAYEYQHSGPLNASDRPYTADADLRPFGGSDRRDLYSAPGNIVGFDTATSRYVSQWAIRPNASGTAQTATDFAAGTSNLANIAQGVDLLPEQERNSVFARVRQGLGTRLDLSADLRFSNRVYGYDNLATATIFTVTQANPYFVSPSGATQHQIAYSFSNDLGPTRMNGSSRSLGMSGGGIVDIGRGWSLDGYLALAEEKNESRLSGQINSTFLNEALGTTVDNSDTVFSPTRDGYFNPFGGGAANSRAVLDFVSSGFTERRYRSRSLSANLLADGSLWALPAGDIEIALGAQVRKETFSQNSTSLTSGTSPQDSRRPVRERTISAIFAEARIPLFGPNNARPGLQKLELSLAGRFEDYDDVGSTTNPKLGLIWSPIETLKLRASYGTSFRAPSLPQIFDAAASGPSLVPLPGGGHLLAVLLYGGNPDLDPETAETYTVGFDLQRPGGLQLSLSLFDTRFSNRIAQPIIENIAHVLTDPALAPFAHFVEPSNPADLALVESIINAQSFVQPGLFPASDYRVILDGRWVNTSTVQVRGLDLSVGYPLETRFGHFDLNASGSYLFHYLNQTTPTAAIENLVGIVGYPVDLRARVGVDWWQGPWNASLYLNHVGGYEDRVGRDIEAWNTADFQLRWEPLTSGLQGLSLSLNVQNVFASDPPFYDSPLGFGFDPGQANILGRVVSFQLIKRW